MIGRTSRLNVLAQHQLTHLSEFPHRDGNNHTRRAREWKDLEEDERKEFFDEHGAHYFELSRLSYFDPVRMSVIDPMHNILLGQFIFQLATILLNYYLRHNKDALAGWLGKNKCFETADRGWNPSRVRSDPRIS